MELCSESILRFDLLHQIGKDFLPYRTYLRLCRVIPKHYEAPFHSIKGSLRLYIIVWTRSRPQPRICRRQLEEHVFIDASLVGLAHFGVSTLFYGNKAVSGGYKVQLAPAPCLAT